MVRRTHDQERSVGQTLASGEEGVDNEVDSGEGAVIADVADGKSICDAELFAQSADFFFGDAAQFGQISAIGKRKRVDGAFAGKLFAERFGNGEDRVHLRSATAEVFANFLQSLGGVFCFGEPIDDVKGGAYFGDAVRAEEFRGVEDVRDLVRFDDREQGTTIAPLAKGEGLNGTENAVEEDWLPNGEFDGSEIVAGRD